jgi:hypothetical protein
MSNATVTGFRASVGSTQTTGLEKEPTPGLGAKHPTSLLALFVCLGSEKPKPVQATFREVLGSWRFLMLVAVRQRNMRVNPVT